ncbi:hypothetical protein WISP_89741 [Willisornis vidua]|uniref:Uncharacterized protein n=1 Tax=Willisornis vidua TaxID=1566151 RepID=A0ABQ9D6G4_9PASS|nr:hypothetical protein WISP_89741 [Willisornis vidua]
MPFTNSSPGLNSSKGGDSPASIAFLAVLNNPWGTTLRDLEELEKWPNVNPMNFKKAKCKALQLHVGAISRISVGWGMNGVINSLQEELRILVDGKLDMTQQYALAT